MSKILYFSHFLHKHANLYNVFNTKCKTKKYKIRELSSRARTVLGIETSCDDTGAAVVNEDGEVLGESIHNQTSVHLQAGGIIPPVARDLHLHHIDAVVGRCITSACLDIKEIDAVAVTIYPGLTSSLRVGLEYAQRLVRDTGLPFIPIHHMEAHALTVRLNQKVQFPYMVMLVSGGHCLLAVARDIDDFLVIGKGLDDAPGDAFDKTARELNLKDLPGFEDMSGGAAIEILARNGEPKAYNPTPIMTHTPDCNFSFAGIKTQIKTIIHQLSQKHGDLPVNQLPQLADICASFQYLVLRHLARRLQRAFLYADTTSLLPHEPRTLVLSGGVASNKYLRQGLQKVANSYQCELVCPEPRLCTDNGIMVAWNGIEFLKKNYEFIDPLSVQVQHRCPLGKDLTFDVAKMAIKLNRRVKL